MQRLNVGASNVVEEIFNFPLGQNSASGGQLWAYNIPVLSSNQKKFILEFESLKTMLLGYVGATFPQCLKILCANASGYQDSTGSTTTVVATMSPSEIYATTASSFDQYTILYTMDGKDVSWDLGAARNVSFILVDDQNNPIQLPMINPITCVFRILHVSV